MSVSVSVCIPLPLPLTLPLSLPLSLSLSLYLSLPLSVSPPVSVSVSVSVSVYVSTHPPLLPLSLSAPCLTHWQWAALCKSGQRRWYLSIVPGLSPAPGSWALRLAPEACHAPFGLPPLDQREMDMRGTCGGWWGGDAECIVLHPNVSGYSCGYLC